MQTQKSPLRRVGFFDANAGDYLISHTLTRAVPSARRGLTSVFGMGTGVTLAVCSPASFGKHFCYMQDHRAKISWLFLKKKPRRIHFRGSAHQQKCLVRRLVEGFPQPSLCTHGRFLPGTRHGKLAPQTCIQERIALGLAATATSC